MYIDNELGYCQVRVAHVAHSCKHCLQALLASIDVRRRGPLHQTQNNHSQNLNCHFQIVSRKLATQTGLAESLDHPDLRAGCVCPSSEHFLQQHLGWLLHTEQQLLQLANGWLRLKQHDSSLVVPSLQNQYHSSTAKCAQSMPHLPQS